MYGPNLFLCSIILLTKIQLSYSLDLVYRKMHIIKRLQFQTTKLQYCSKQLSLGNKIHPYAVVPKLSGILTTEVTKTHKAGTKTFHTEYKHRIFIHETLKPVLIAR